MRVGLNRLIIHLALTIVESIPSIESLKNNRDTHEPPKSHKSVTPKKKGLRSNERNPLILMWAQQGMILRPPDYESGALTS